MPTCHSAEFLPQLAFLIIISLGAIYLFLEVFLAVPLVISSNKIQLFDDISRFYLRGKNGPPSQVRSEDQPEESQIDKRMPERFLNSYQQVNHPYNLKCCLYNIFLLQKYF